MDSKKIQTVAVLLLDAKHRRQSIFCKSGVQPLSKSAFILLKITICHILRGKKLMRQKSFLIMRCVALFVFLFAYTVGRLFNDAIVHRILAR